VAKVIGSSLPYLILPCPELLACAGGWPQVISAVVGVARRRRTAEAAAEAAAEAERRRAEERRRGRAAAAERERRAAAERAREAVRGLAQTLRMVTCVKP